MLSQQFLDFIKYEKLFKPTDKLVLAISGGIDSVVLAYLLKEINQPFCFAHMNFQLRGKDSQLDQEYVEQLAKELQVDCFVKTVTISKKAGNDSTQMQARELRYKWFHDLREQLNFQHIVTGHHSNDNLETAILNLTRGTGIKGIRGILPKKGVLCRPLLFASSESIYEYAQSKGIEWREDKSNQETVYKRNFIRKNIIPSLQKINPNLTGTFHQSTNRLRLVEKIFNEKMMQISSEYIYVKEGITFVKKKLLLESLGMELLVEVLLQYGFSYRQLHSFDFERIGALLNSSEFQLNVDREELLIVPQDRVHLQEEAVVIVLEEKLVESRFFTLSLEKQNGNKLKIYGDNFSVSLNADNLPQTAEIRKWKHGDSFQPLGMKGQKKVSDYLIDKKVPLTLKNNVRVFTVNDEIAWIIGFEVSDKFKVTDQTQEQLKLTFEPKKR